MPAERLDALIDQVGGLVIAGVGTHLPDRPHQPAGIDGVLRGAALLGRRHSRHGAASAHGGDRRSVLAFSPGRPRRLEGLGGHRTVDSRRRVELDESMVDKIGDP